MHDVEKCRFLSLERSSCFATLDLAKPNQSCFVFTKQQNYQECNRVKSRSDFPDCIHEIKP
jgi:hypothetical protein